MENLDGGVLAAERVGKNVYSICPWSGGGGLPDVTGLPD